VIFDELCAGKMYNESRERFVQIINRLVDEDGVQGVILGCTEIPLLIKQRDVKVPVFDTMTIHAEAAVKYALSGTWLLFCSAGLRFLCLCQRAAYSPKCV
jgi:aspartate racemase